MKGMPTCDRARVQVLGISLLYVLAAIELIAFPLLGAGTAGLSEVPELPTVSILDLQVLRVHARTPPIFGSCVL